jgi:peptidylprolyl isomerase
MSLIVSCNARYVNQAINQFALEREPLAGDAGFRKRLGCGRLSLMKRLALLPLLIAAAPAPVAPPQPVLAPSEIVAAAPKGDWVAIAPADLIVMELAADARGKARRVVIQLMPAPFSQGWVGNIRKLVAARWYDGVSVNRVQDNYVVQWGDADGEDAAKARALPATLQTIPESGYVTAKRGVIPCDAADPGMCTGLLETLFANELVADHYGESGLLNGWPVGTDAVGWDMWPVHCYGMVGVGRGLPPRHRHRRRALHRHRPCAAPSRPEYRARRASD